MSSKTTKIQPKKLPLTIVIITHRNDDRFINTLSSSQIANKVIIVDNNSGNKWKKLKKEFNFNLISHENKIIDFAKVRNSVLEKVKTDWVFFLDSDEIISNVKNVKEVIDEDLFDGVTITRQDVFLGKTLKFGEAGNIKLVRMFKVKKGKFIRNVHETVEISGKLGVSEIIISHFSHPSISEFLKSVNEYAKLSSKNERSSEFINILKIIFYPLAKFAQNYFFRLGFLDGYRGLIYAIMMSFHSFFVRVFYFENYFQENINEYQN